MNCSHVKNKTIAFIEKNLSQEDQVAIENHLSSCNSCRTSIEKIASVYNSFDATVCPEINPYFYSKTLAKLSRETTQEISLPVSVINSLKPIAAGLFVVTSITFGIFFGNILTKSNSETGMTSATAWANDYHLDYSEDIMVELIISNEE